MIGGTYEYIINSLPDLSFHSTDETKQRVIGLLQKYAGNVGRDLSPVEILDNEAKKFLPEEAFYFFEKINLQNIHEPEFKLCKIKVLADYATFTFELKNEIKNLRTSAVGQEQKSSKNVMEQLVGEGTPLEKENHLLKYQWDRIDEISAGHLSDMEALFSYKIKLLLLLRRWSFNMEKGYENYIRTTTNR
jgi:hypothetical protein